MKFIFQKSFWIVFLGIYLTHSLTWAQSRAHCGEAPSHLKRCEVALTASGLEVRLKNSPQKTWYDKKQIQTIQISSKTNKNQYFVSFSPHAEEGVDQVFLSLDSFLQAEAILVGFLLRDPQGLKEFFYYIQVAAKDWPTFQLQLHLMRGSQ